MSVRKANKANRPPKIYHLNIKTYLPVKAYSKDNSFLLWPTKCILKTNFVYGGQPNESPPEPKAD